MQKNLPAIKKIPHIFFLVPSLVSCKWRNILIVWVFLNCSQENSRKFIFFQFYKKITIRFSEVELNAIKLMFQYFLSLKVYWAAYSTKKYNRFTATAVKKIRIIGQETTICNTSIKLWGKNSVTRSIIAPKKSYFFPHSNCQIFFYVLSVRCRAWW